ncbi:MAG: cobaltochelatase subunit CobN, partial [Pseudomonadota bacterium]
MHLLATTSGVIDGAAEAVDLNQPPGDIVVLTAADSEIASLARAHDAVGGLRLRLANLMQLQHNLSVDLYAEKTLAHAKLIVVRLLGGASYWSYGLDRIEALARARNIKLAVLPGDANPDAGLTAHSTIAAAHCGRLHRYLAMGGERNARGFLAYCHHLLLNTAAPEPAEALPKTGIHCDRATS